MFARLIACITAITAAAPNATIATHRLPSTRRRSRGVISSVRDEPAGKRGGARGAGASGEKGSFAPGTIEPTAVKTLVVDVMRPSSRWRGRRGRSDGRGRGGPLRARDDADAGR